jgi:putative Ca2+/H+ antiporter (TMEM165/GDT1 family)
MYAFLVSAGVVAVGEIGDKTQLLALLLALRFRRPWPIVFGILTATLLNHAAAGALGTWLRTLVDANVLRYVVGASFVLIALWALVPDKLGERESKASTALAVFTTTAIAFFLAEIGDKTQVATIMLAARFDNLIAVIAGTTAGMLIADVPAVLLADRMGIASRSKRFASLPLAYFSLLASGLCSSIDARIRSSPSPLGARNSVLTTSGVRIDRQPPPIRY